MAFRPPWHPVVDCLVARALPEVGAPRPWPDDVRKVWEPPELNIPGRIRRLQVASPGCCWPACDMPAETSGTVQTQCSSCSGRRRPWGSAWRQPSACSRVQQSQQRLPASSPAGRATARPLVRQRAEIKEPLAPGWGRAGPPQLAPYILYNVFCHGVTPLAKLCSSVGESVQLGCSASGMTVHTIPSSAH